MDYTIRKLRMKSGQAEVTNKFYTRYRGRGNKTWYVAKQLNSADNIYVDDPSDRNGFGGASIKFHLSEDAYDEVVGPWHGNADALYDDTGIDVRMKYATIVVLGKGKRFDKDSYSTVIEDVVHLEEKPVISVYHRGKHLAKSYANELKCRIFYHIRTQGGSETHFVDPDEE